MTRPRIALTVSAASTPQNIAARERYLVALRDAGADVVVLEPGDAVPDGVAGVCFAGGPDVHPRRYGAVDVDGRCGPIDEERDGLELALARRALDADLPVLGICRGFQLLNVAFGGSLAMHVDGHQVTGDAVIEHVVEVPAGTRLSRATAPGATRVNSRHHQAVTPDRLATSLRATVLHDGLVEAFESDAHRWVVGVQWHPERTPEVDASAARIFAAFVAEASRSPIGAP